MNWLLYFLSLFPVCQVINGLEIWLSGLVLETSNTLDDLAVRIVISMLRKAFHCEIEDGTGTDSD